MTPAQQFNRTSLSHPKTQWSIEAAMWRAVSESQVLASAEVVRSTTGREIVTIIHDRQAIPAFTFYRAGVDVTEPFLAALRACAK